MHGVAGGAGEIAAIVCTAFPELLSVSVVAGRAHRVGIQRVQSCRVPNERNVTRCLDVRLPRAMTRLAALAGHWCTGVDRTTVGTDALLIGVTDQAGLGAGIRRIGHSLRCLSWCFRGFDLPAGG